MAAAEKCIFFSKTFKMFSPFMHCKILIVSEMDSFTPALLSLAISIPSLILLTFFQGHQSALTSISHQVLIVMAI